MWHEFNYRSYLSTSDLQRLADKKIKQLRKQGQEIHPIEPFRGNKIAKSFWGHAWCRHLEGFSDFANRLPRGRSYVRNGSVCHLGIAPGEIRALVMGSELYELQIRIEPLPAEKWNRLKARCSGQIGSLMELLQGKLSSAVMAVVTDSKLGLFPSSKEIRLDCNCPDYAGLCKHLAAALYGVGVRLDSQPELLFLLRGVDHSELIAADLDKALDGRAASGRRRLPADALADVFGIEVAPEAPQGPDLTKAGQPSYSSRASRPDRPASSPAKAESEAHPLPDADKIISFPLPPATRSALSGAKKASKARKTKAALSPRTGKDVAKLRRKFDMSEWEFGVIAEVTSTTVRNWEEKGGAPHNARAANQETLDLLATLSKVAAWDRLDEYL